MLNANRFSADIAASNVDPKDAGKAIDMIAKASEDMSNRKNGKLSTLQILSELYKKLEESSIPTKLYKSLEKFFSR